MQKNIFILILLILVSNTHGQNSISGKIYDSKKLPIEFATVFLKKDSIYVNSALTDSSGYFKILNVSKGNYNIFIKHLSYIDQTKYITANDSFVVIELEGLVGDLAEVTIKGKQAIFERKVDRLVFNVENRISSSIGDAVSLLKQTPGIVVNKDDVNMSGKSSVIVMLDERPVKMEGTELISFLKSISATDVSRIEVITTPPAKYEAEGNSGIVNIRLKKLKQNSQNAYLQGNYIHNTYNNGGLNSGFNYKRNALLISSSISGVYSKNASISTDKIYYPSFLWDGKSNGYNSSIALNPKINMDYALNSKWETGLQYIGTINTPGGENLSNAMLSLPDQSIKNGYVNSWSKNNGNKNIHSINWHHVIKLDTIGRKINIDADHLNFTSSDYQYYNTVTDTHPQFPILAQNFEANNQSKTSIKNYALQTDFEHPIAKLSLNYGLKISHTETQNSVYYKNTALTTVSDIQNDFSYSENTQALYASIAKELNKKLSTKAGLRFENTQTTGFTKQTAVTSNNNYYRFFPTFFLNYLPKEKHHLSLTYNHRIRRPGFYELNPFRWYNNQYSYTEGNPLLRPFITKNLGVNYDYKNTLFLSLALSNTTDATSQVPVLNTQNFNTAVVRLNYYDFNNVSFNASHIFQKWDWFESQNDFNIYYIKSTSKIYPVTPAFWEGYGARFSTSNSFVLNKKSTMFAGIDFSYNFKGQKANFQLSYPTNRLDVFYKATFYSGKLQLTIAIENILKSNDFKNENRPNELKAIYTTYNDTRYAGLSIMYKFGKAKLRALKRNIANQEEKERVN